MHYFPVQGDLPHACEGWTNAQRSYVQALLPLCRLTYLVSQPFGPKRPSTFIHPPFLYMGFSKSAVLAQGFSKSAWLTLFFMIFSRLTAGNDDAYIGTLEAHIRIFV